MPYYLLQAAYTPDAWLALAHEPEDRIEAIRPVVDRLGGRVIQGFLSFGEYDIIAIVEMPDAISAAAFSMASSGGGAVRVRNTTPLLTMDEARQAMRLAGGASYPVPAALQRDLGRDASSLTAAVGQ
jgi:uncharacterized protein with GYD domain